MRAELQVKRAELLGLTSQRQEVAVQLEASNLQQSALQAQLGAQQQQSEAETRRADTLQAQAIDLQQQLLSSRSNALDAAALKVITESEASLMLPAPGGRGFLTSQASSSILKMV